MHIESAASWSFRTRCALSWPLHDIAMCMVYGIQTGGRMGVVYCAIVVQ